MSQKLQLRQPEQRP